MLPRGSSAMSPTAIDDIEGAGIVELESKPIAQLAAANANVRVDAVVAEIGRRGRWLVARWKSQSGSPPWIGGSSGIGISERRQPPNMAWSRT